MILFFVCLIVAILVNEALVELLSKSVFFFWVRKYLDSKSFLFFKFFSRVINCPFCCSVWTSAFLSTLVFSFSNPVLINNKVVDFFLFWLFCFRSSNYIHDWHDKKLDKYSEGGMDED